MIISRETLLQVLESVSPGVAAKENFEQSSCLVFYGGDVCAYNGEILCRRESPVPLEGAVKAKNVLELLAKLPDDEVDVARVKNELIIKGRRRKAGYRFEDAVLLPLDEIETAEEWWSLPEGFNDAVGMVSSCVSTDEKGRFVLTCVHLCPDYIEASDRYQAARAFTELPLDRDVLVRGTTLQNLAGYDMTEMSETDGWLHFRNPAGLTISCRKIIDDYRDLSEFFKTDGSTTITFPGSLAEIVDKAQVFSAESVVADKIVVDLRADRIVIEGHSAAGWYKEMKEVDYAGEPMRFLISPKLLVEANKRSSDCGIMPGRLCIDGGRFKYITCTEVAESIIRPE